jgi:phospholipid-binding lipoprotein MlaA
MKPSVWNPCRILPALTAAALLALPVCVRAQEAQDDGLAQSPYDPLEKINRGMFAVHEGLDKVILKPLAQGYDAVAPSPVKAGVVNFYDNIRDINRSGNAFLQGKPAEGLTSLGRLLVNSTVGVLGLFDVASEMGMEQGEEDFGQTLAVWGVPSGPYLFVPLVGPSTARDIAGFGVDQYASPLWHRVGDNPALRNSLVGLNGVKIRAAMLPLDKIVDEAALDRYAYIRSAYLQRRAAMARDGKLGDEDNEENNAPAEDYANEN